MRESLVQSAPNLELEPIAFQQTVGWSRDNKSISLRQYIASRAPQTAQLLHIGSEEATDELVARVEDLDESELREVVCARLQEGTNDARIAIVGEHDLSIDELIDQVRARTELGHSFILSTKRSIGLLEQLAEAGKIRISKDSKSSIPSIKLPDFTF